MRNAQASRNASTIELNRRDFLGRTAAAGLLVLGARHAFADNAPIVETISGKIRGVSGGDVQIFKGVPYGASTAGTNRFMAPHPPEPWTGIRDAVAYAGHAPQWPSITPRRPELKTLLGPRDTTPTGEDCLTLNLWTPGLDHGAKRPVMVWLHGGGMAYGSANLPLYDGSNLARRADVVVVGVNHRLNGLGFLHLADIGGEAYSHSGNAGMLDLVAALHWVHDNIERFGGDPVNVTIFGESGGGGKVSTLLAMQAARGLFHRAIIQSGAAIRLSTRERANALAEAVLKELGIAKTDCHKLQDVPVKTLIASLTPAREAVGPSAWPLLDRYDFGPVVDGADIPAHPFDPVALGISDDVPLVIGNTKDEASLFLVGDDKVWNATLTETELKTRVARIAGADADRVIALYRGRDPKASPAELLIAASTGGNFWIRSVMLAERKVTRNRAPVYFYAFNWATPIFDGRLKSHHAIDLPFTFDTVDAADTSAGMPGAQQLAAATSATWATFARNGNPDNPAIPHWPAYTLADRATMVLDTTSRVENDPGRDARLLWSGIAQA
ncbi:MAG: carboxylesterase/lipase family protein [Alphaproteobacteria bacterium]|nr:carboxylesterase/lipase family protein [Alphaproteobacteria bacterium]